MALHIEGADFPAEISALDTLPCVVSWTELQRHEPAATDALVDAIRQHSFCVLRLDDDAAAEHCFEEATECAAHFFEKTDEATKRSLSMLVDEYGAGTTDPSAKGLLGYNTPSDAKEVFRIRAGSAMTALWDQLRHQPHVPAEAARLPVAAERAHELLQRIVGTCLLHLFRAAGLPALSPSAVRAEADAAAVAAASALPRPEKRVCAARKPVAVQTDADRDACQLVEALVLGAVAADEQRLSTSPFDLFRYRNGAQTTPTPDEPDTRNCGVHVDPGWLTAVPVARTPGLCVRDAATDTAVPVRRPRLPQGRCRHLTAAAAAQVERRVAPLRHVCVFAGHTLQRLSAGRCVVRRRPRGAGLTRRAGMPPVCTGWPARRRRVCHWCTRSDRRGRRRACCTAARGGRPHRAEPAVESDGWGGRRRCVFPPQPPSPAATPGGVNPLPVTHAADACLDRHRHRHRHLTR